MSWFSWLYFDQLASTAAQAFAAAAGERRAALARDAYTLTHFLLIAGMLYIAVGAEQAVASTAADNGGWGSALPWPALAALFAGTALYLLGLAVFCSTTGGPRVTPLAAAASVLALLPAARQPPALLALALIAVLLVLLVVQAQLATEVRPRLAPTTSPLTESAATQSSTLDLSSNGDANANDQSGRGSPTDRTVPDLVGPAWSRHAARKRRPRRANLPAPAERP